MRRGLHFNFRSRSSNASAGGGPISERARLGTGGFIGLLLFFSVFFLLGSTLLYFMFVTPLMNMRAAQAWPAVPAVVQESEVVTHHDSDGNTYSIRIVYTYEVDEVSYTSERYDFRVGSSSGRSSKQSVVSQYPPGKRTTAYVNPADPTQAVLYRGVPGDTWFGLIPLLFMFVGLGGMLGVTWAKLRSPTRDADVYLSTARDAPRATEPGFLPSTRGDSDLDGDGQVTLKPEITPAKALGCMLVFAIFWNGFIGTFAFFMLKGTSGAWSILPLLFLLPFAGVGLLLIGVVVHQALALANPKVTVQARSATVALGDTLEVAWAFAGQVQRLTRLRVALEGVEKATYTRGTDTVTDTHVFARYPLEDTDAPRRIAHGRAAVALPLTTMHSFKAKRNEVVWSIRLHGDIRRWPDVDQSFPLTVAPAADAALAATAAPPQEISEEGQP